MKRMLADALWQAANERLSTTCGYTGVPGMEYYSCCALGRAIDPKSDCLPVKVDRFIRKLGCNTDCGHFYDHESGMQRQGVRYMWLLLAMHVAEDEGIEL